MELKIKHIVLTAAFCLFSLTGFSQFTEHPPEPMSDGGDWEGCGEDGLPSTDPSAPPGLCLPIDDYVIPLLVVGMIIGGFKMYKIHSPASQD